MSNNVKKPHILNKNYEEHPDYAINIIEAIAVNSFQKNTKELQKTYGIEIDYIYEFKDEKNKLDKVSFKCEYMGACFCFLPVLLSTKVQKTYNIMFPDEEFPIGLCLMKNPQSFLGTYPTIRNLNNFSAIMFITDYEIEKMINKKFIQSILPLSKYAFEEVNLKKNNQLQEEIAKTIKEENLKKINIDITYEIMQYENLTMKSRAGEKAIYYPPTLDENNEISLMGMVDIIHAQEMYFEPEYVRLGNELELQSFIKPEFSSKERYDEYIKQQKIRAIKNVNQNISSNNRLN